MQQTASTIGIQKAIKGLLKKHGYSYKHLAEALKLSEAAIKQLMTKGSFTTNRLESVASWFGLSLLEFMEIALKTEAGPHKVNQQQEQILFSYPISIWLLFLLGSGFSVEQAKVRMNVSQQKFQRALHVLDRTGLIELLPQNRIRLKSRGPYQFNKQGVIERELRKEYLELISSQIQLNPTADSFQKTFELYFSESLLGEMKQELEILISRYAHLTRIECEMGIRSKVYPVSGLFLLKPFDGWGTLLSEK